MRAWLRAAACAFAACMLTACGDATPAPTTGMTLTVEYDNRLASVAVSGTTLATSRKFGPFILAATRLESGDTVGLTFDAADRGSAMICGEGRDRDGVVVASACGIFSVRAGEVTLGTLTLTPLY